MGTIEELANSYEQFMALNKKMGIFARTTDRKVKAYNDHTNCTEWTEPRYVIHDGHMRLTFVGKSPETALARWRSVRNRAVLNRQGIVSLLNRLPKSRSVFKRGPEEL